MSAAPDKPATLLDAFNHYRLPQPLRQSLLDLVGAESEDDDPEILAHIPTETLEESVRGILIDGAPPTPMQVGHIWKFLKHLRRCFNEPHLPTESPQAAPPPLQPIVVQVPNTDDKLLLRDYLDQTMSGSFDLLGTDELMRLRDRFEAITGAPPRDDERPSDEQLSALAHRLRVQSNGRMHTPWVEFATFGPFDGRAARNRAFNAHVLARDGTWRWQRLSGPSSFVMWRSSWRVFAASMVMLEIASPGSLQQYEGGSSDWLRFSQTIGPRSRSSTRR